MTVTIYEDSFAGGSGVTPNDGTPNLAAALRATVDDLTELRTQFVALLAKLDTEVTLEEILQLLNDAKAKYEAHRILTGGGEHDNADTTNAVSAADATDLATGLTLANDLKAQLNAHLISASELEEAITLLNEIKVDYEAHRILTAGGVHGAADSTNVVTAADATDEATAITLANDLKTQYEAHRVLIGGGEHGAADSTNVITAADASDHATLILLANDLRTQYEAHRVLTAGAVHGAADSTNVVSAVAAGTAAIHLEDDTTNTVSSADATSQSTLATLANEIRTDYEAHRVDTTSHGAADATNPISEPAASADYESTLTPSALTLVKG